MGQIVYSVFHGSPNPGIVVGTKRQLVEIAYIREYCSRDIAEVTPFWREWTAEIRQMQDAIEARGQTFVYVLTPSKAAQYPDLIPADFTCPSSLQDREKWAPTFTGMLRAAGVHVADASSAVHAARQSYPFPLFPRGGLHWGNVGAALGEAALATELTRLRPSIGVTPQPFAWHMAEPRGTDGDLAAELNLLHGPNEPLTPTIDWLPESKPATCPVHRIVFIGGSFSNLLANDLSQAPCKPGIVIYNYWLVYRQENNAGKISVSSVDSKQRAYDFDTADVIVYESNEESLDSPYQGTFLYRYLFGHPPRWPWITRRIWPKLPPVVEKEFDID